MIDPSMSDALAAIDAATTQLGGVVTTVQTSVDGTATRVDALLAKLSTAPTPEEVAAFKDSMNAEVTRLNATSGTLGTIATTLNGIAADPNNPVPPVVPPV